MGRIDRLAFLLGGVLVPSVSQAALRVLSIEGEPPGQEILLALHGLEAKLCTGRIDSEEFCQRVIQVTGRTLTTRELAQGVQSQIIAEADVLSLINELEKDYLLQLICDYPREWVLPALPDCGLAQFFPIDQIAFIAGYQAASPRKDLILALEEAGVLLPGKTLLVDSDPARTRNAVRMGIEATIYVSAWRLRRDLRLWGIMHNNP